MRVNEETKSVDMEERDVNYIMPAYIVSYLFQCKNEDPERITFPMYPSVPHPRKPGVLIPIEYVPPDSPVAVEIKEDGADVPEATMEQVRQIDEKEDRMEELKEAVDGLRAEADIFIPAPENVSPARAAFADEPVAEQLQEEPEVAPEPGPTTPVRVPKQPPGGALPPGTPLDGMQSRTPGFERQIAKDIAPQVEVNEEEEVATEIEKPKE